MPPERLITLKGFLSSLLEQHSRRKDRPFCFILGAGASSASGIATGTEMAREWLQQLHEAEDFSNLKLEEWATAENLGIQDFDINNLGRFYPELYSRRFIDSPEAGYAFLEDKMQGKDPSFGYSVLAYLLAETPHKIVITTNFDNLVADALSIHSTTFPIVVGHDALAGYAQVDLRRPLVAKVHGGLGFAPKSSPEDLESLSETWQKALKRIFERYTPIVIGYDGNDGCFMKLLEDMQDDEIDGLYWCFYCPNDDAVSQVTKVPERVRNLVNAKQGRLVPIPGFDELMLLIKERLGPSTNMPNLLEQMKDRARKRESAYDEQERALSIKLKTPAQRTKNGSLPKGNREAPVSEVEKLLSQAVGELAKERKEKPWWMWEDEASSAGSLDEKDSIYKNAISALPGSAELMGNYAVFLSNEQKDLEQAEVFYKRAIEADPKHANNLGNYAFFLENQRKDMDQAEAFYKRALEADPKHAGHLGNYAIFLSDERKDMEQAEAFYKRAIEADPKHANTLGNYANFLKSERKDIEQAEAFYKRAIEADPKHVGHLGNYANFLKNERKDMELAEVFYKRALEADPKHANNLGNYAIFLKNERKDMEQAEAFYKRALEADPKHANTLGNYAQLCLIQGRLSEGLTWCQKAEALSPLPTDLQIELCFYRLAHDQSAWPEKLGEMENLLSAGKRSLNWPLEDNVAVAEKSGHPHIGLLRAIAQVISHDAPIGSLEAFDEWPKRHDELAAHTTVE